MQFGCATVLVLVFQVFGSVPTRLEEIEKKRKKTEKKEKKDGKKGELSGSRTLQVLLLVFDDLYLLDIENSILVSKVLNYIIGRRIWLQSIIFYMIACGI
jgi:hypothetical protein